MAWWILLHGNPTSARVTNRLLAVDCALRVTRSSDLHTSSYLVGRVTDRARKLETWLSEARDETDMQIRRTLLMVTCAKTGEDVSMDRLLPLVKQLHHYVTRS
jgi:hypothetical protein